MRTTVPRSWCGAGRTARPQTGRTAAPGRLVDLDDCRTLIPLDRPEGLAAAIRDFAARTSLEGPSATP
ncbi:hypothetical protein [Streptomyces huasconensis]|uniref:hypothetical protein n=1 Tax=Streptomyces huasconensis TaxID=1854574 RepID=UPI0034045495